MVTSYCTIVLIPGGNRVMTDTKALESQLEAYLNSKDDPGNTPLFGQITDSLHGEALVHILRSLSVTPFELKSNPLIMKRLSSLLIAALEKFPENRSIYDSFLAQDIKVNVLQMIPTNSFSFGPQFYRQILASLAG